MELLFFNAKYGGGSGQVMLVRACLWSQKVLEGDYVQAQVVWGDLLLVG